MLEDNGVRDAELAVELVAMIDDLRRRCPWLKDKSDDELADILAAAIRRKSQR